jgi:hypothetical protein
MESVAFVRSRPRRRGCRGWSEVSFLELMSQLFREFDFGIASEPSCRFDAGIAVLQLNLEHDRLLEAYRVPAMKCLVKTDHEALARRRNARPEALSVKIHNSAARRLVSSALHSQPSLLGRTTTFANDKSRPILFAVGMRIAAHPPHRSEQAPFTHSAPTSGV